MSNYKSKFILIVFGPLSFICFCLNAFLIYMLFGLDNKSKIGAAIFLVPMLIIQYVLYRFTKGPFVLLLRKTSGLVPYVYAMGKKTKFVLKLGAIIMLLLAFIIFHVWPKEMEITSAARARFPSQKQIELILGDSIRLLELSKGKQYKYSVVSGDYVSSASFKEKYKWNNLEYEIKSEYWNYVHHDKILNLYSTMQNSRKSYSKPIIMDSNEYELDKFTSDISKFKSSYFGLKGNNLYLIEFTPGIEDSSFNFVKLVSEKMKLIE